MKCFAGALPKMVLPLVNTLTAVATDQLRGEVAEWSAKVEDDSVKMGRDIDMLKCDLALAAAERDAADDQCASTSDAAVKSEGQDWRQLYGAGSEDGGLVSEGGCDENEFDLEEDITGTAAAAAATAELFGSDAGSLNTDPWLLGEDTCDDNGTANIAATDTAATGSNTAKPTSSAASSSITWSR